MVGKILLHREKCWKWWKTKVNWYSQFLTTVLDTFGQSWSGQAFRFIIALIKIPCNIRYPVAHFVSREKLHVPGFISCRKINCINMCLMSFFPVVTQILQYFVCTYCTGTGTYLMKPSFRSWKWVY